MKLITFSILFLSIITYGNDTLTIFNKNKEYHYQAIFIKANGDTLSTEKIILKPTGEPWKIQKNQTAYKVTYKLHSNAVNIVNPVNKRQKRNEKAKKKKLKKGEKFNGIWILNSTTGAYEGKKEIWIHPFRNNQYVYTEIAPFPEIRFENLITNKEWTTSLEILAGWDNFKGKVKSTYTVKGQVAYKNENISLKNCWQINAIGEHSSLGKSTHNFIFNSENGFVQMDYTFYNGVKIQFKMTKIIDKQ